MRTFLWFLAALLMAAAFCAVCHWHVDIQWWLRSIHAKDRHGNFQAEGAMRLLLILPVVFAFFFTYAGVASLCGYPGDKKK